jgi:hypothetical protein
MPDAELTTPEPTHVPVLIAERLRDQLESFGMCDFDGFCFQDIAQRARHDFRIAKIAHESTFFIGERRRSVPALPTRSPMARARRELIRSPSQKGAGGRCIGPAHRSRRLSTPTRRHEHVVWSTLLRMLHGLDKDHALCAPIKPDTQSTEYSLTMMWWRSSEWLVLLIFVS